MAPSSSKDPSLENRLIGNIVREYPQMARIMERYFGGHCLKRPGLNIKTLGMACLLFGIDKKRLLQEFDETED